MAAAKSPKTKKPREIVLVLRLRAGNDGWWGQVRDLGQSEVSYVRNSAHLAALLEKYWQLEHGDSTSTPAQEGQST